MTYEIHGWFDLRLSPGDDDENDRGQDKFRLAVENLRPLVDDLAEGRTSIAADLRWLNGEAFFDLTCLFNHVASNIVELDRLLDVVNNTLPGSFGILYEWSDDESDVPSVLEYSLRVMTRGKLTRHTDPFLSPIIPVVEDDTRFTDGSTSDCLPEPTMTSFGTVDSTLP